MEDYFDLPFYYVKDMSGFADGQNYEWLSIDIDGDSDFALRAVLGVGLVCSASGGVSVYDSLGRILTPTGPVNPGVGPLLIQPEIVYPRGSQIRFSVTSLQRSFRAYTNPVTRAYYSRLVFAGVKRFTGQTARSMLDYQKGRSQFRHQPYILSADLRVSVTSHVPPFPSTQLTPPSTFRIEVENYDFDVFALLGSVPLLSDYIMILPYDAAGRQLATDFVPSSLLSWSVDRPWACFPSSPIFYVSNSSIRFDWMSLYTDGFVLPTTIPISFVGARRIPC